MAELTGTVSTWRASHQGTGVSHAGLLSKLSINSALYDIKDPAVDALASAIDTELNSIKVQLTSATTWEEVTKSANAPKFATSVTQGTDGAIEVLYGDILSAAYETGTVGKFVTNIYQNVDGTVTGALGEVSAENVSFAASNGVDLSSTNVKAAIEEVLSEALALKGTSGDATSAETIAAAKNYAEELVNNLAGEDWSENAKTVKAIIDELSEGGNADFTSVVDKVRGDFSYGTGVDTTTDIKHYIDGKFSEVQAAASGGISELDTVETGTSADNHVSVEVTEVDGKITSVAVTSTDIASAQALSDLDAAAVKSVNGKTGNAIVLDATGIYVTGNSGTTLLAALNSKFDADSIGQTSIAHWQATYADEQLSWNSTNVTVYAPSSANSGN